ncbi:MAG: outer membrane lipoprotein-sorting protein [Gammaproteobacteria bacterium]|nr:outer membrane lipoprotein-sorting protein [Gammaproteobacteria bacterium]
MKLSPLIFSTLLICSPLTAFSQSAEERGLEIAQEADQRDNGFQDVIVDLKMELSNRHGQKSIRQIKTKTLEVEGDGDKAMSIFSEPRDVKGTAMLTYTHKTKSDDQWLYLPALKRIKRISSSNKSGPFMGSEFAYEDLSSQEVEKYQHKWLRDETLNGVETYVLERIPVDKKSGYRRQVIWLDKEHYRMQKMDFYDRKNSLIKTLTASGYQLYLNQFWRADELQMKNHPSGKSTLLHFSNYRFKTGLKAKDFSRNSLKRAR